MSVALESDFIYFVLTRRNLETLLAKLNGHPPGSSCTILKGGVFVRAVENEAHYSERTPGPIHPGTAEYISDDSALD